MGAASRTLRNDQRPSFQIILSPINSWDIIESGKAPAYLRFKVRTGEEQASCVTWLRSLTTKKLTELEPEMNDTHVSGVACLMFHFVLNSDVLTYNEKHPHDKARISEIWTTLHTNGLNFSDLFNFGEALFLSLTVVLAEEYTLEVDTMWKTWYSSFLHIAISTGMGTVVVGVRGSDPDDLVRDRTGVQTSYRTLENMILE
jgi:hypothetical protein